MQREGEKRKTKEKSSRMHEKLFTGTHGKAFALVCGFYFRYHHDLMALSFRRALFAIVLIGLRCFVYFIYNIQCDDFLTHRSSNPWARSLPYRRHRNTPSQNRTFYELPPLISCSIANESKTFLTKFEPKDLRTKKCPHSIYTINFVMLASIFRLTNYHKIYFRTQLSEIDQNNSLWLALMSWYWRLSETCSFVHCPVKCSLPDFYLTVNNRGEWSWVKYFIHARCKYFRIY